MEAKNVEASENANGLPLNWLWQCKHNSVPHWWTDCVPVVIVALTSPSVDLSVTLSVLGLCAHTKMRVAMFRMDRIINDDD